jgi:hypothetical protein
MSNQESVDRVETLTISTKAHADMLVELLEKAAAQGAQAQTLADLYRSAKAIQKSFNGP